MGIIHCRQEPPVQDHNDPSQSMPAQMFCAVGENCSEINSSGVIGRCSSAWSSELPTPAR